MLEAIRDKILAKLFQDSFKQIEKINWMSNVLKISFRGLMTNKKIWNSFIDSVIGVLEDAIDEAKGARSWADEEEE